MINMERNISKFLRFSVKSCGITNHMLVGISNRP